MPEFVVTIVADVEARRAGASPGEPAVEGWRVTEWHQKPGSRVLRGKLEQDVAIEARSESEALDRAPAMATAIAATGWQLSNIEIEAESARTLDDSADPEQEAPSPRPF